MPELVAFPVERADVTSYYEALSAALTGNGPALAPFESGTQSPLVPREPKDCPPDLALVVATSGSTGAPKRALLTRQALLASAHATHARLGGAGTWLLPLPPQHIAGTQVLVRSIVAGTTPIVLEKWSTTAFMRATALVARNAPPFSPIYTSLVPTQLRDVMSDDAAQTAARRYRAILVGGAATPVELCELARAAGLQIVTTYGSSETAGGCVYDGLPLDDVELYLLDKRSDGKGRLAIAGPTLASGYLESPELTSQHFRHDAGRDVFVTDDLAHFESGLLRVDGRVDDVITTGGYKVSPSVVEETVRRLPEVSDALCLGIPDERWGQVVCLAIQPGESTSAAREMASNLDALILDVCHRHLPPYAIPRRIATFDRLPTRGIGKPDRAAVAELATWRSLRSTSSSRSAED